MATWRLVARNRVLEEWSRRLRENPEMAIKRVVEAIGPRLRQWVERSWGGLTYRLTQMLTGHGCFGEYLCRIGRECGAHCHHCDGDLDTAQHTLEVCPAWDAERGVLVAVIGGDLSFLGVVGAMLGSERKWCAVSSFCEQVMLAKEEAERAREPARDDAAEEVSRTPVKLVIQSV
ncbi:uncharacterized protein [Mycetomoellerius zeteki]|uniref:uncharacterized protein n=1 Tax=Mycetomoellerius zeteki TaxID=64791 RepID=UPI00084E5E63|nr:PREDICTED: uncharacterized protein LOC108724988 [Trachymyrmex zeteki]